MAQVTYNIPLISFAMDAVRICQSIRTVTDRACKTTIQLSSLQTLHAGFDKLWIDPRI